MSNELVNGRWGKINVQLKVKSSGRRKPTSLCVVLSNQTYRLRYRMKFLTAHKVLGGTAVAQWLRRCATNRKVVGSIQILLRDVVECGCVYARSEPAEQLPLKQ